MKCSDCPEYEVCRKYDLRKVRPRCKKSRTPKVFTNAEGSSITPTNENGYHMDMLDWLKQPAEED